MAKKIVAANWKMNLVKSEAVELFANIEAQINDGDVEVVVFPSSIFLSTLIDTSKSILGIGAQNFFYGDKGAFTGEVSANQLKDLGCTYVLIGHSERRILFSESTELLQNKIKAALNNGLKVIFCCGESLEERENGSHELKIRSQLDVLKLFTESEITNISVAYEPIWAIGTGLTASPLQAEEMHAFIRGVLKDLFSINTAENTSLLYGGSCNEKNAADLFNCPNIDGGLIGGASLKVDSFVQIVDAAK